MDTIITLNQGKEYKRLRMTPEFFRAGVDHIKNTAGSDEEYRERMAYFQKEAQKLLFINKEPLQASGRACRM